MAYTINQGFMPMTGEEMLYAAYNRAVSNGFAGTSDDFLATNTHTVLSLSTITQAEKAQLDIIKCVNGLMASLKQRQVLLGAGNAGSCLDLTEKLKLYSESSWITNKRMVPAMGSGEFGLFIEGWDESANLNEFMKPYLWPGAVSCDYRALYPDLLDPDIYDNADTEPRIQTVNVTASNKQNFSFEAVKMKSADKLRLDIQANVIYKSNMFAYTDSFVRQSIIEEVSKSLGIGQPVYSESLLNVVTLPNIASMQILTRIEKFDDDFVSGNRMLLPYQSLYILAQNISINNVG